MKNQFKKLGLICFDAYVLVGILLLVSSLMWNLFHLGAGGFDDLEHEASAWFIYNGFVPYRDFFQHHHPLLWYIMAPFFHFLNHPIEIYRIGRIMSAIVFLGGFFWIKNITLLLGGNTRSFLYSVFIYLAFPITMGNYLQNRPDTYMVFCALGGLYFWIRYTKNHKTSSLIFCYLFFFFSFAFLQKSVLFLIPFAGYQLYLIFSKKLPLKQVFIAIALPLVFSFSYVSYLFISGSLQRYWEVNWLLNMSYFRDYRVYKYSFLDICLIITCYAISFYLFKYGKGIIKHLSVLFLIFSFFFLITPKPYFSYWLIWVSFCALIMGTSFSKTILSSNNLLKLGTKAILFLCFITIVFNVFLNGFQKISPREKSLYKLDYFTQPFEATIHYISQNIDSPDDVISYHHFIGFFLRPYPAHYYWFALNRGAVLDSRIFHHQLPDWDRLIKEKKPKFIIYEQIFDQTHSDDSCEEIQLYGSLDEFMNQHYHYSREHLMERID